MSDQQQASNALVRHGHAELWQPRGASCPCLPSRVCWPGTCLRLPEADDFLAAGLSCLTPTGLPAALLASCWAPGRGALHAQQALSWELVHMLQPGREQALCCNLQYK